MPGETVDIRKINWWLYRRGLYDPGDYRKHFYGKASLEVYMHKQGLKLDKTVDEIEESSRPDGEHWYRSW